MRWRLFRQMGCLLLLNGLITTGFYNPERPARIPLAQAHQLNRPVHAQTVELSLPDLQTLPPYDLRLILNPDAGRMWIRFSNSILNSGPGALELSGKRDQASSDILVSQNIYYGEDQFVQNPLGKFEFEESHNHWHYDSFSLYEVWNLGLDGQPREVVASSGKVSYCVRDSDPIQNLDHSQPALPGEPQKARYLSCGWNVQGLSPGWVDTYWQNTPGQYVDISGLPDGDYLLVSTVDPENLLVETNEDNNAASLYFTLQNDRVVMGDGQVLLPQSDLQPVYNICQFSASLDAYQLPGPRFWSAARTAPCIY